jgi:hypothetical protein
MLKLQEYTLQDVQGEVQALIMRGAVGYQNHLYDLVEFFGYGEWRQIQRLLESNEYLLRDNIIDLVGRECWAND